MPFAVAFAGTFAAASGNDCGSRVGSYPRLLEQQGASTLCGYERGAIRAAISAVDRPAAANHFVWVLLAPPFLPILPGSSGLILPLAAV